ncbi:LysR family transcriptional regulator [Bacillus taeanensis]|uniref:LysR family transcriptional regulator n=1 Tax=Bacillus taeanensis TaxID=273032 RepID=A0A366XXY9_9BACI|nr:LysR family transcriptional regulator [Bacillus taeanensis]RBW69014.1 LysR family transcriptional regulator [Bacillus taeanensis]
MNIDALKVFIAVAELKNFSRAAEQLNFSQPSISLQIRNLEKEFQEQLVYRSPKHVELTKAGKILYRNARDIISLYNDTITSIDQLKNIVSGSLKIGASYTIGEYVLPKVLAQFAADYPEIDIEVKIENTDDVTEEVRHTQLDMGLIEGSISYDDIVVQPFMEDEMVLITAPSHPLAKKQIIDPKELHNQVWIMRETGSGTRAYSDLLIKEWNLPVSRSFIFSSSQGIKEAVINGLGIAILSHLIVAKELERGELVAVTIKKNRFVRQLSIIHPPKRSFSKAEEVFLEKLLKER